MRSRARRRRLLPCLLAIALISSGCTSGPSHAATGAKPAAVALPDPGAGPDAAALPPAAPDPGGAADTAATELAKQVRSGGRTAEAALRTALTRSGITLTEVNGQVVTAGASPSLGLSIPIGQLMFVADQNTYDHGHSISVIASMINAIYSDRIDPVKLRGAILSDLRTQAAGGPSTPATQEFLCAFIIALGMQADPVADIEGAADNDLDVTGLQTWLIWLSIGGGAYTNAVAADRAKGAAFHGTAAHAELAADSPCSAFNGTAGDASANAAGAVSGGVPLTGWDGIGSLLPEGSPGQALGAGDWLAIANAALAIVRLIVEGLSLTSDGGLSPSPLVRTKGIAPALGADGTLTITLKYDLPNGQYANCLRTQLNGAGLDFSLPNDGPVKDAEVDWHIINDPGGVDNNPVKFYSLGGGSATTTRTDDGGTTKTGLQGNWQKSLVPEDTQPFDRHVQILAGVVIKPTEILQTLNDALSTALGGLGAPVLLAVNLAERSQVFDVTLDVTIKDWPLDFKIDADMDQSNGSGQFPHISGVKCNGVNGEWKLDINGAPALDFTLDKTGKGVTQGDLGSVNVVLLQGDPAKLQFSVPGAYYQTVAVIPGQFCEHHF